MRDRRHLFDKNFTLLWKIFDENLSWYLDDNIKKYADNSLINKRDEVFRQSNRMHAVNGYVFGNMPVLNVCRGDYVGWFVTSYGSKFNVHSVKFHGHNLVYHDKRSVFLVLSSHFYTPVERRNVLWNRPVRPSVCLSVHNCL